MGKLKQITTVEELYFRKRVPTGNHVVDGFVDFLENTNLSSPADAVKYLGISPILLSETIKFFVGAHPREMLPKWRVLQALDLMDAHPDMPRQEVAKRCGYNIRTLERRMMETYGTTVDAYQTCTVRRNSNYFERGDSPNTEVQKILHNAVLLRDRYSRWESKTKED